MRFGGLLLLMLIGASVAGVVAYDVQVQAFVETLTTSIFQLFKEHDSFPLLLAAGLIVFAGAIFLGYAVLIVVPRSRHVSRLTSYVSKFNSEEAFTRNYDDISQRLRKSQVIGHAWKEFQETLVEPQKDGQVFQNTVRPQAFINIGCAQDQSLSLRLMPHIPNYFVGIGLLLTFVGLVAALNFASDTVDGDAQEAIEGLQNLLQAATFKFWTSIAGLLASIVLSFCFRLFALHLEQKFSELCQALEQGLMFATPQRIFVDVRDTIQKQLEETKKTNTDVAMAIADGVGRQIQEKVPNLLAAALAPVVEAVQKTSEKVGQGATDGLADMVDGFAKKLEGSTGSHMQELSQTLQNLQESLSSMQGTMDSSGDAFVQRMAEGTERLERTMREVAESINEMVAGLKDSLGNAGNSFGDSIEEAMERLAANSVDLSDQMANKSQQASEAFAEEIRKAAQSLSESANENAQTTSEFAEQLRNRLDQGIDGVQSGLEKLSGSMEVLDRQLEKQGANLATVSDKSETTALAMESAASSLESGLQPFQRVGEALQKTTEELRQSTSEMASGVGDAVAVVNELSSRLTDVSDALENAWENYRARFEAVDEDLERAFGQMQESVSNNQALVTEFVQKLDNSFGKALTGLSGGMENMKESVEEFTEALEDFGKQFGFKE